ncbi:MAG: J domain-containing protein [Bradyrhizobium sp.]|nr:J domain-containing protein [Bradyrhizobium sp.]
MMTTLYDLLGALPKDSAGDLRAAFRCAVKGSHPDLHPGDPDAAVKFREIVRASEILGDAEQREVYDHLLDLAQLEHVSASEQATAARFRRLASGLIGLAGAALMTAGSYLLFMHVSVASVAPAEKASPAIVASAAAGPTPDLAVSEAASALAQGVSARRSGTAADPAPASLPVSTPAERGVSFDRLRKFDRAFADLQPAKRTERPDRARSASTRSGRPRFVPDAIARPTLPLPRRRPTAPNLWREESVASMRQR